MNKMSEIQRFGADSADRKERPNIVAMGVGGAGRNILTSIEDPSLSNVKKYEVGQSARLPDYPFIDIDKIEIKEAYTSKGTRYRKKTPTEKKIQRRIEQAELMYIVSGLGGDTGSWTTPVCSSLAKESGLFTIALVSLPFAHESESRHRFASEAREKLESSADITAIFSNERLLDVSPNLPINEAFDVMNSIIRLPLLEFNAVMTKNDIPHLERFCDGVDTFKIGGGYGKGRERGKRASEEAYRSPWLEDPESYNTVLAVVTSGKGTAEIEAQDALDVVREKSPKADIMWGLRKEPEIGERTRVTILAGK